MCVCADRVGVAYMCRCMMSHICADVFRRIYVPMYDVAYMCSYVSMCVDIYVYMCRSSWCRIYVPMYDVAYMCQCVKSHICADMSRRIYVLIYTHVCGHMCMGDMATTVSVVSQVSQASQVLQTPQVLKAPQVLQAPQVSLASVVLALVYRRDKRDMHDWCH
jgi:hypothetical protein